MRHLLIAAAAASVAMTSASAAVAADHVVRIRYNPDLELQYFDPPRLEIRAGDRVTWVHEDRGTGHNVVAYPDGIPEGAAPFESPMMRSGDRWSLTFTSSGTYNYHCHPHEDQGMRGVVVVDRESRPDEMRKLRPGEHSHGSGHKH